MTLMICATGADRLGQWLSGFLALYDDWLGFLQNLHVLGVGTGVMYSYIVVLIN